MSETNRQRIVLAGLLVVATCVFLPGIRWGLPSRAVDPFLFGKERPWTGAKILELAGGWGEANVGADVDRNPLGRSAQPVVLNETHEQRAEIIRRYRLFSNQPDETITFRALSQMQPGALKLDPKLYQYGGLWIYPVGAMLKAASIARLIDLRGDLAFYLDNPEQFGRFYVVARLYTAAWGLVGGWAGFWCVRRVTKGLLMAPAGGGADAAGRRGGDEICRNGAHEVVGRDRRALRRGVRDGRVGADRLRNHPDDGAAATGRVGQAHHCRAGRGAGGRGGVRGHEPVRADQLLHELRSHPIEHQEFHRNVRCRAVHAIRH